MLFAVLPVSHAHASNSRCHQSLSISPRYSSDPLLWQEPRHVIGVFASSNKLFELEAPDAPLSPSAVVMPSFTGKLMFTGWLDSTGELSLRCQAKVEDARTKSALD